MARYNVKWAGSGWMHAFESDWESAADTIVEASSPSEAVSAALIVWAADRAGTMDTPADYGDLIAVREIPEPPPAEFFTVADPRLDHEIPSEFEFDRDMWQAVLDGEAEAVRVEPTTAEDLVRWQR